MANTGGNSIMHIPPYYKKPAWQHFFSGSVVGAICGYLIFLLIFGELQQEWIEENLNLRTDLQELNQSYETLLENHEALDKESKESMTLQEVEIQFTNLKELKLENDRIMVQLLKESIQEETSYLLGKPISEVNAAVDLLISSIENKTLKVDDFKYEATVKKLIIANQLKLSIELKNAS